MKQLVAGILAHVDAGKTTLSEGILYLAGSIRKLGRVDHRDAHLDTDVQERNRGITIFSKPAELRWKELELTLIDTPGHVDFSAEMERALQVLDCAVLVISGTDGVQGHTETLWQLLARYRIPTFLFVNKMDLAGASRELRMLNLKNRLSDSCVEFPDRPPESFYEELALCSEELLEEYMERGRQETSSIAAAVRSRQVFPVFFGSALKLDGVERLLDALEKYCPERSYPEEFGAKVYKIGRDEQGKRLTWMKITGGSLRVREPLSCGASTESAQEEWKDAGKSAAREKVDQIRIYNGAKYRTVDCAPAGTVCAVTGLTQTHPGQGLGKEISTEMTLAAPVMTWRLTLPAGTDAAVMLKNMRQLEEEEPLLHIRWNALLQEIQVQLMGEVQIEVLTELIRERFGVEARFDEGSIMYRETIAGPVEGMGHFEPLRHYAEVHLWMEPGEPGSGLVFGSAVSEDELDKNWQRLILTHLREREHAGVLTGAPITDMRITLVAGRAHIKHTEGGDFRQATYRAVRHGLMRAGSVLLEPYYEFRMELPPENLGRAMSDIERMCGRFAPPEQEGEYAVLSGSAPVSEMQGYAAELIAYSHGRGRLACRLKGYLPCHNPEQVIAAAGYRAEADIENSADSVFCANGAGFVVPWQEAEHYMHLPPMGQEEGSGPGGSRPFEDPEPGNEGEPENRDENGNRQEPGRAGEPGRSAASEKNGDPLGLAYARERELEEIFRRTFGEVRRRVPVGASSLGQESAGKKRSTGEKFRQQGESGSRDVSERQEKSGDRNASGPGDASGQRGASRRNGTSKQQESSGQHNASNQQKSTGRLSVPGSRLFEKRGAASGGLPEYLLVDGYNVIFAWEELAELARENLDSARQRLMDILCNYQGFVQCRLILVFDAYRVRGGRGEVQQYHNIHVVYTREAETADMYIEKVSHELGRKYRVTVATSDALEQLIVIGQGAVRISSRELKEEVELVTHRRLEEYMRRQTGEKNYALREALEKERS